MESFSKLCCEFFRTARTPDGDTILHVLSQRDFGDEDSATVDKILGTCQSFLDIRSKSAHLDTPLHRSLSNKSAFMTMALLRHGASVEAVNLFGQNALHLCIAFENRAQLGYILDGCAGRLSSAQVEELLLSVDAYGHTALFRAVNTGKDAAAVQILRAARDRFVQARLTAKATNHMRTPLAACQTPEMAHLLLSLGRADPFQMDAAGSTAVHWAAYRLLPGLLYAIVEGTAAEDRSRLLESRDLYGQTALLEATRYYTAAGGMEAIRALIDLGADLNARDNRGRTPLHHAMLRGHSELVVELLLTPDRKADPEALDVDGRTPLMLTENRYEDCAKVFQSFVVTRSEAASVVGEIAVYLNADVANVAAQFMFRDGFPGLANEVREIKKSESIADRVVKRARCK